MSDHMINELHARADAAFLNKDWQESLACYAEIVRLNPGDHMAQFRASCSLLHLGEKEKSVLAYLAAAERLLANDYLLSAIVACKEVLRIDPEETRVRIILKRIHARASKDLTGRSPVPTDKAPGHFSSNNNLWSSLVGMTGTGLVEKAMDVLAVREVEPQKGRSKGVPLPLLADLGTEAFVETVERMDFSVFPQDEVLIEEGKPGDAVFIICAGGARVFKGYKKPSSVEIARVGDGSLLGEMSLLTDAPRSATVVTDRPSDVFTITRDLLQDLSLRYPSLPQQLVTFCRRRLLTNLVEHSPLFSLFEKEDRISFLKKFVSRVYEAGTRILEEGKNGDGLYVILSGEVWVTRRDSKGALKVLASLREGDVFGEMGMIRKAPASADVTAVRKTAAVMLPREIFDRVLAETKNLKIKKYLQNLSDERLEKLRLESLKEKSGTSDLDLLVV